ncbi:serine-threonine protein kinase, putative [Entamoeba invadens IP1]|uniref:Serine-threonine protein kinase, putative n=1 Tax=Entamoeba invadens IP1 TaxID=370355 RepID=A0A0A1TYS0_ENTIV|nr:serine-threonine protein kinase, putative [Entamoeba invadens IP1]ELP86644.1 serine-threonine protein kinase, putative [Entamoeba invadens IP1]|eukprot:XP_004185990.1 serine-threonine protein kinase, putative [Entamoeba invadens IP1]
MLDNRSTLFNVAVTLIILLLSSLVRSNTSKCSSGCITDCLTDYTCTGCSDGYDNDTSCLHCTLYDVFEPIGDANPLYVKEDGVCVKPKNYITKVDYLPDSGIIHLEPYKHVTVEFTSETPYDRGPCVIRGDTQRNYRRGFWFEADKDAYNGTYDKIRMTVLTTSGALQTIYIHCSDTPKEDSNVNCYAQQVVSPNSESNFLQIPIERDSDNRKYYFWVFIEEFKDTTLDISLDPVMVEKDLETFKLDQQKFDTLISTNTPLRVVFNNREEGKNIFPVCAPTFQLRSIFFNVEFASNYSLVISTLEENRLRYLQEYGTDNNGSYWCISLWEGKRFGALIKEGNENGLVVRLSGTEQTSSRFFCLMSQEQDLDIPVSFYAICPNHCNEANGQGYCSKEELKCLCKESYGGPDCRKLCYYNGAFTIDSTNKCMIGTIGCDYDCLCTAGYSVRNHLCVSDTCLSGNKLDIEQCLRGSEGCGVNCYCASGYKSKNGYCILETCGNGKRDGGEECDNSTNCNFRCKCDEGYIWSDKTQKCDTTSFPVYGWILIAFGCFLFVIACVVIILVLVLKVNKRIDMNVVKLQQPEYYYNILGSISQKPSKESKFLISPTELGFGNDNHVTEVFDTRYEKITLRNYSKNKYMMVIFHTPNNPKYVFHFDKQVEIMYPNFEKETVCFMTLHCTSRIRDMKINYTVWFSKNKSTLLQIAELLKDKNFESWSPSDQSEYQKLIKNVIHRYHNNITIITEAASSTHLDMDELNVRENPIAEGAMGKVFVGSYRSLPVAIKRFRWEDLDTNEMEDLKKSVIQECLIMKKLRNPFVANYIGSVTYIPQVSMVIQFFVLGSLGEYLLKSKPDYIKLPYKLKLKMLFDASRGMQFLHDNKIMHLDLKPDNLLVNSLFAESACCVKITDFGTSRFMKKNTKDKERGLGTPLYLAPECFDDEYSNESDVYSFGIMAWEVFYQEEPYNNLKSLFDIKNYVKEGKRLFIDEKMPLTLKNTIEKCWKQSKTERGDFENVSKNFVKMIDEADNWGELDNGVNYEEIKNVIERRNKRLEQLLEDDGVDEK